MHQIFAKVQSETDITNIYETLESFQSLKYIAFFTCRSRNSEHFGLKTILSTILKKTMGFIH